MEGFPPQQPVPFGFVSATVPAFVVNPQKYASWYKSTSQSITGTGAPAFTTITFNTKTASSDNSLITLTSPTVWTVNVSGTYFISCQITYANLNTATFSTDAMGLALSLTRSGATASVIRTSSPSLAAIGGPSLSLSGYVEMRVGDTFSLVSNAYMSATGSSLISGVSSAPNDFDLYTSLSWTLVNSP